MGGIEGASAGSVSSACADSVCMEAVRYGKGVLFVELGFTNLVIRSGVFAGVTLSMNCHEGSSSTIELWSEWFGMGMSDAESMSFWNN